MRKRNKVSLDEILNGSLIPVMFKLGGPVMITGIFETVYNLADTFWLGHLPQGESGNAVAGLQVAFPIIWFLISFAAGFAMAGIALVSQYTGAQKEDKASFSASQVLSIGFISGLILGAVGSILVPIFMPIITPVHELSDVAITYLRVIFMGFPFMFISSIFRAILSAYGDTVTPMYVIGFSNLLNIVLDPILIFGIGPFPKMGIVGAAVATVFSRFVASLISLYILMGGKKGIKVKLSYLKPHIDWLKKIFKIGLPASIGNSFEAFGFVVLMGIIGRLPNAKVAVAAYGIGDRIFSLSYIAEDGLGQGLTTIIGQSLGADRVDRADYAAKRGILLLFLVLLVESLFIIIFRRQLMSLFIPNELSIIEEGARFLLLFAPALALFGIIRGISSAFHASGHNVPPMIISMVRLWAFRLPLSYIFGFVIGMGSSGVWIAMSLSNLFTAIFALILFARGEWKKKVIEETPQRL